MVKINILLLSAVSGLVSGSVLTKRCKIQSCVAADAGGSTGFLPPCRPAGGNAAGDACIRQYLGADHGLFKLPYCKTGKTYAEGKKKVGGSGSKASGQGGMSGMSSGMNQESTLDTLDVQTHDVATEAKIAHAEEMERRVASMTAEELKVSEGSSTLDSRQACKPYILVYAKGTGEPGAWGISVGPALKSALAFTPGLELVGVNYDASIVADFCLGLPGGVATTKVINQLGEQCPKAKFIISGYSQGAIAAHIGLANAKPGIKKRAVGVVTFGDPNNGATIKGYTGPIKTFCAPGDGVCGGQFSISAAHLSYTVTSIGSAASFIKGLINN